MALSTFEVIGMFLLAILFGIAVWWFIVSWQYRSYLKHASYARGANATEEGQTLNLSCDQGKEICVYRATQICSDPDSNNFENQQTDPISSGLDGKNSYGDFNSDTTVDRTADMSRECNGKQTSSFKFAAKGWPNGMTCHGKTQLISTYSCIPKGTTCSNYKNLKI